MLQTFLVPENTVITAKGEGRAVDVSSAGNRVFLATLNIIENIEQESLDVHIHGSADGATWGDKPLASFPQKFYRGQHPLLVDLTGQPEIKFLRTRWDVNRWGRGTETPRFSVSVLLREVPAEMLREAKAEAKSRA